MYEDILLGEQRGTLPLRSRSYYPPSEVTVLSASFLDDAERNLIFRCVTDSAAAARLPTTKSLQTHEVTRIVERYVKEARRLQLDIKHEAESKMISLRHRVESELIDLAPTEDAGKRLGKETVGVAFEILRKVVVSVWCQETPHFLRILGCLVLEMYQARDHINTGAGKAIEKPGDLPFVERGYRQVEAGLALSQ